jgi:CheY-like chemotaxis protein
MAAPDSLEPSTQRRSGSWKGKLLVVDEDMEDLQHYSAILNRLGYEVRPFARYDEAAACLGEEVFDLVLVCQGTNNFEGRSVLARAIEKDRRTHVLILNTLRRNSMLFGGDTTGSPRLRAEALAAFGDRGVGGKAPSVSFRISLDQSRDPYPLGRKRPWEFLGLMSNLH